MIIIVPGVNGAKPLPEILEGLPFHQSDILQTFPEEAFSLNKELVHSITQVYTPTVLIGKSYGAYIMIDSFSDTQEKIIAIGLPLVHKEKEYPFPGKNSKVHLIYGLDDPHIPKGLEEKYSHRIATLMFTKGDHSLRPLSQETITLLRKKIAEVIYERKRSRLGRRLNMHDLMSESAFFSFFSLHKKARIPISKSKNYTRISDEDVVELLENNLATQYSSEFGPITDIVMRSAGIPGIFMAQSNIVDTSKINSLIYDCAATGGFGIASSAQEAVRKAVYEAVERYALSLATLDTVRRVYDKIPSIFQVPKKELQLYTQEQRTQEQLVDITKENTLWTPIRRYLTKKELLYPYCFITPSRTEHFAKETTSTGTATGTTFEQAMLNGLLEAVERHTLMSWFYQQEKYSAVKINVATVDLDQKSKSIFEQLRKEKFTLHTYIIVQEHVLTCFIIATNGETTAMGSASGFNQYLVAKALEEVLITRIFMKTLHTKTPRTRNDIKTLPQHCLYYQGKRVMQLINYLDVLVTEEKDTLPSINGTLDTLLTAIELRGHHVYYKELTTPINRLSKLIVIKVIVFGFLDLIKKDALLWNNYHNFKQTTVVDLPAPFP